MIISSILPSELLHAEERSNASQLCATGCFRHKKTQVLQFGWGDTKNQLNNTSLDVCVILEGCRQALTRQLICF